MAFDISVTIRRLMAVFIAFFVLVSGWLVYWQVFWNGTAEHQAIAASYDPRQCVRGNVPRRGSIYDRNGKLLAYSTNTDANGKPLPYAPCGWQRHYTDPLLAPLLGYYDPTGFGVTGVELAYNTILSGAADAAPGNPTLTSGQDYGSAIQQIVANTEHLPRYGSDIYLTIDKDIQDKVYSHYNDKPPCGYPYVAQESLPDANGIVTGRPGSIVVEDPHTGAILAMISYPTYDNDKLVNHTPLNPDDPQSLTVGQQYFNQLLADPNKPLIDRPIQTAVVPGSTFKMLTMIAAYDSGQFTPQSTLTKDEASSYTVDGHTFVTNNLPTGLPDSAFPIDLTHLFAYSDNVAYARVAVALGKQRWLEYAGRFGLSYGAQVNDIPFDLPVIHSWVYQPQFQQQWGQDNVLLADTGYGQGKLLISPLMVTTMISAIAADGQLYTPHLQLKVVPHGVAADQVADIAPPTPRQVMGVTAAHDLQQAMRAVVSYGTGALSVRARASAVLEGGKTGTGDLGQPLPTTQSWWSSMAPVAIDENGQPTGMTPRYVVVIQKDLNGEGFCQSEIALDIYEQILLRDLSGK